MKRLLMCLALTALALTACAAPRTYTVHEPMGFGILCYAETPTLENTLSWGDRAFVTCTILEKSVKDEYFDHDFESLHLRVKINKAYFASGDIPDGEMTLVENMNRVTDAAEFAPGETMAFLLYTEPEYGGMAAFSEMTAFHVTAEDRLIPVAIDYGAGQAIYIPLAGLKLKEAVAAMLERRDANIPPISYAVALPEIRKANVIDVASADLKRGEHQLNIPGFDWGMDISDYYTSHIILSVDAKYGYRTTCFDEAGKLAALHIEWYYSDFDDPDYYNKLHASAPCTTMNENVAAGDVLCYTGSARHQAEFFCSQERA